MKGRMNLALSGKTDKALDEINYGNWGKNLLPPGIAILILIIALIAKFN